MELGTSINDNATIFQDREVSNRIRNQLVSWTDMQMERSLMSKMKIRIHDKLKQINNELGNLKRILMKIKFHYFINKP